MNDDGHYETQTRLLDDMKDLSGMLWRGWIWGCLFCFWFPDHMLDGQVERWVLGGTAAIALCGSAIVLWVDKRAP